MSNISVCNLVALWSFSRKNHQSVLYLFYNTLSLFCIEAFLKLHRNHHSEDIFTIFLSLVKYSSPLFASLMKASQSIDSSLIPSNMQEQMYMSTGPPVSTI